ncbi:hypothetical protein [Aeromonas cavernicola]|uniref:Uncharacterized protein n=1 Tax=Aeromonas cavernicola TaxID=1006623 RepID=A0A2H9U2Q1_9GAMM|nr:hypothetical protein [Aeromonas cavernicola]PJG58295.1 hypothetical protein CUC53_13520 [Aeromonas cavernicola]
MGANVVVLNQGYDQSFDAKEQQVIETLASYESLIVSFSGRLESCYNIDLCRASGAKISAITLDTPTRSRSEVARARRYCQRYGIAHWIIKTDEIIFCDRLPQLVDVIDPVRRICDHVAERPEWAKQPILMPASAEERVDYLGRFGSSPANTLWPLADHGFSQRELRYGFNKRQLGRWGKGGNGCLSHRFSNPRLLKQRYLRMVDRAEQLLADMGLDEAQVFFHSLCDGAKRHGGNDMTLARVRLPAHQRARAFDLQSDILSALKGMEFDLVTLDMVSEERHDLAI